MVKRERVKKSGVEKMAVECCLGSKRGWWPKAGMVVVKKGGGDGSGSLSGDGCCGLCTYALSCKKS